MEELDKEIPEEDYKAEIDALNLKLGQFQLRNNILEVETPKLKEDIGNLEKENQKFREENRKFREEIKDINEKLKKMNMPKILTKVKIQKITKYIFKKDMESLLGEIK